MKKYLIALSLVGLATTSCYEKLNIAPPNAITDEQVQALLKTADEATVVTILGGMADNIPTLFKASAPWSAHPAMCLSPSLPAAQKPKPTKTIKIWERRI